MTTPQHEPDLHLLVSGYALDALGDHETRLFESHLRQCRSCQEELGGLRATAVELGVAAAQSPPPSLRSSVLHAISVTPQLPALTQSDDAVDSAGASDAVAPVIALRRRPLANSWLLAAAAAAAVLVVAVTGLGWRTVALSNDLTHAQTTAAAITSVLTAADARTTASQVSGGGRGVVVSSESMSQAVVVTDGLAPTPAGKVYQLWMISPAGAATPVGFLDPGREGRASATLTLPPQGAGTIGVTVEPAGGSPAPTTTPILAVKI